MTADEVAGPHGIRFAPSPTGPFHVGNLRTAWVSWKIAQSLGQPWIVRVEDIDTARVKEDAWSNPFIGQLSDLHKLGLFPDQVLRQSEHHLRHENLFKKAVSEDRVYPCDCSRSEVRAALNDVSTGFASAPHEREPEYSGHCRNLEKHRNLNPVETLAWRWRLEDPSGRFDPVIARTQLEGTQLNKADQSRHFQPGYHFACAVDDADGGYRLLVRAWDLAPAENIQKHIRRWVSPASKARVFHCALVTLDSGKRLEKRTKGITLAELKLGVMQDTELVQHFEDTFDLRKAVSDIKTAETDEQAFPIVGEARKTIVLSELSIRP
jgi:glutamyl-tRNA synthetase